MKILDLTISDFRGFGRNRQPLDLEGGLVLFHGPNGYGKSSVAEAIEWLFYAATQRRQLGDAVSKTEYAGTYGNVHRSAPAEVSARVLMPDGREHVLTRRLALDARDEDSQLFIDGEPGSFAEIGVYPAEPACPVIAQHSLQAFIHTKPKERRDAISAALGLEEVTLFKSALDSARRSFSRTPPSQVTAARALLKGFAPALATGGILLLVDVVSGVTPTMRAARLDPPGRGGTSDCRAMFGLPPRNPLRIHDCFVVVWAAVARNRPSVRGGRPVPVETARPGATGVPPVRRGCI
jgi:energy-coupling factor transporter ATP-binding protein EcfA2